MQIKPNGTAKGEHSHPTEEAQIRCLYLRSPAFHHQPKLVTIGEHGTSETLSLFKKNTCVITHSVTSWHSPVDAGESGCFL